MFHRYLLESLQERPQPLNVVFVGCGWFGGGTLKRVVATQNTKVSAVFAKTQSRAIESLLHCGVAADAIEVVEQRRELLAAIEDGKVIVCTNLELLYDLPTPDVVFESTGDVLAATQTAVFAIKRQTAFVTATSEMDATVGLSLANKARQAGSVYSNVDGDQPGVIARLIDEATTLGFQPRLVGNCKGFLDPHQTPTGVLPYVAKGHDPRKVCSFADGSKQALELACVANAFGYLPTQRGMIGPTVQSKQQLVNAFSNILTQQPSTATCVDFVLGLNAVDEAGGVFVIAEFPGTQREIADLKYLKKGPGPYYLFFRDHHLCYFEAASTIFAAGLMRSSLLSAREHTAEVVAIAKRDLGKGSRLDGIGGFDGYGIIETADAAARNKELPLGLAEFATTVCDIPQDKPIRYDMVRLEENAVTRLRIKPLQIERTNERHGSYSANSGSHAQSGSGRVKQSSSKSARSQ